jgi:hypothetical protein
MTFVQRFAAKVPPTARLVVVPLPPFVVRAEPAAGTVIAGVDPRLLATAPLSAAAEAVALPVPAVQSTRAAATV